jgi:hypothetical protein
LTKLLLQAYNFINNDKNQKMTKINKRKYDKKLKPRLFANKEFLINQLNHDWSKLQKDAKREQLLRYAKDSAMAIGKTMLGLLAIAGVLSIAAVAPNVFGAFGRLTKQTTFFNKTRFNQDKNYLKNTALLKLTV